MFSSKLKLKEEENVVLISQYDFFLLEKSALLFLS